MDERRKTLTVTINGNVKPLNHELEKLRKQIKKINKELGKTESLIRQIRG